MMNRRAWNSYSQNNRKLKKKLLTFFNWYKKKYVPILICSWEGNYRLIEQLAEWKQSIYFRKSNIFIGLIGTFKLTFYLLFYFLSLVTKWTVIILAYAQKIAFLTSFLNDIIMKKKKKYWYSRISRHWVLHTATADEILLKAISYFDFDNCISLNDEVAWTGETIFFPETFHIFHYKWLDRGGKRAYYS